jgi:hypothetical protein
MQSDLDNVYYILGTPEGVQDAPRSVEIPRVFQSEDDARSQLGVVMCLSEMVYGELIARSTSWYLQTAVLTHLPLAGGGNFYLGYTFEDDLFHPIAGGFTDRREVRQWQPFVYELERQRAHEARLPWRTDILREMTIDNNDAHHSECRSTIRFRPLHTELMVRPLDMYVTEPLF